MVKQTRSTMDASRPNSACALCIFVVLNIFIFKVSEATPCGYSHMKISNNTDRDKTCCKVKRYVDREVKSQFPCSDGCCGDVNDEHCCQVLTAEELGYVIGFSLFGLLIVVVVSVIMFFVLRYACRQRRAYLEHKRQFNEMYSPKALNELLEAEQGAEHPPFESPVGTVVHPMVSDQPTAVHQMVSDQPTTVHDRPEGGAPVFSVEHHS